MKLLELISELSRREENVGGDAKVIIEIDKANLPYDGNYSFMVRYQNGGGAIVLTPISDEMARDIEAPKYISIEFDVNRYDCSSYGSLSKFIEFKNDKSYRGNLKILINIETRSIEGWNGPCRPCNLFEKLVDTGIYTLYGAKGNILSRMQRYVPNKILPPENGYGDYLELDIDEDGIITNWYEGVLDYKCMFP
jgi:hypothetical protein